MIFRFVRRDLENEAVAVAFIMSWRAGVDGDEADAALGQLAGFRRELYLSLGMRRDVLLEACDAALCKPGRVLMLAELCLERECRRGQLAAAARGDQPGPVVLPLLRAGEEQRADDLGLTVLARRRAGAGPVVV